MDSVDLIQWALDSVDGVQHWWSAGHPFPTDPAALVPTTLEGWIAPGLIGLFGAALWRMHATPLNEPAQSRVAVDQDVKRPTNSALLRRLWWSCRPPADLMKIDGLVIDRTRKPHAGWFGPTGAGKSSAVAAIRVDGKRPTLIATPDLSDPLVAATLRLDGFRWTSCSSTTPINFLIGTPQEVAERLTEVFRSGGVGAWKRTARMATALVIRSIDDDDEPRTLKLIGQRLQAAVQKDRELKTVCAGWVARFLDLADQFGSSIGPDGVDIAELLQQGRTVLLDNDSFDHTSLGGDVVALGLAEAKRCASLVPGGFRLIFEEAGQLGDRIDLAEPFHRAGRRRRIAVDDLTQAESDLNEGISANIATRVYFAQELKSLQKIAADRLGLPYSDLDPANLKDFHAYVAHGRIRRLVHFPKPPSAQPQRTYPNEPTQYESETPRPGRITIEELRPAPERLPSLPPPRLEIAELLNRIDRSGHCYVWTGAKDRDGYGIVKLDGKWERVHRIVWSLANGPIPLGENGKALDLDHHCRNRLCSKLDHLEPVTRAENVRRMWQYRARKGRAAI